jgi:UDP-glucose 4-epimerase
MKVLVTGGSGFIGSHLVPELVARDYEVTILDNFVTGTRPSGLGNSKLITHVEGSILDENLVSNLISNTDEVVHLAAAVGVANIIDSPLRGIQTNVIGSEIVIRNCARQGRPLLLTSSSEIYGKNNNGPLNENSDRIVGVPQKQRWSYSDSKAIEEALALAYSKEAGLPLKIVRLFNTVGPGQKSEYGMVIPRFIKSALSDADIEIYGDGKQTRCFIHVKDAVDGILGILKSQEALGEVFNLGNPIETSILELAETIVEITKSKSKLRFVSHHSVFGPDFEDMERRIPDISKATRYLTWFPSRNLHTILTDIVSQSVKLH